MSYDTLKKPQEVQEREMFAYSLGPVCMKLDVLHLQLCQRFTVQNRHSAYVTRS